MMNSADVLKSAMPAFRRALKARGFASRGNSFLRRFENGNVGLIAVQKSTSSSAQESLVTLNYGVYCSRLGSRLGEDPSAAEDVWRAHWRERLSADGQERWLHVGAVSSPGEVSAMLVGAAEEVLPDLVAHADDGALAALWLSGRSPGLTEMQRLLCLSVLLHEAGAAEQLKTALAELRSLVSDGVHEQVVSMELRRAGIEY